MRNSHANINANMNNGSINIVDLNFTYYGSDAPALKNINLDIKQGEFVVITGMSGCGKSTLAMAIAGYIKNGTQGELQGKIIINERNINHCHIEQLAGEVGIVLQEPEAQLCTFTVREEIAFGPENLCLSDKDINSRIYTAANRVGIERLLDNDINQLSGGEKQRVAIAAMLAMEPTILILDEPTANLDPDGALDVITTLQKIKQTTQHTIIVIEHRIEQFLPLADRIVLMEQGQIVYDGSSLPGYTYYQYLFNKTDKKIRECLQVHKQYLKQRLAANTTDMLQVTNVNINIDQKRILSDISFNIKAGELVAVMGKNGCGKTSMFLSLLGIYQTETGSIILDGKDLSGVATEQRAKDIGLTFQNPNHQIFEKSVYQEMILPYSFLRDEPVDEELINQLLKELSLDGYKDTPPYNLSQGEKKRLILGEVMAYNPKLLLLDEPMAGQDKQHVDFLLQMLFTYCNQGNVCLVACHQPQVVFEYFDRVLFFDDGKLLYDGKPAAVFELLTENGYSGYDSRCM